MVSISCVFLNISNLSLNILLDKALLDSANERLNDIDDFPKRKSAFQGVVGEMREKMERFYGACDCLEALIWSFGKELGTGQFCDLARRERDEGVDNRAYKDDISGIKVATVALKVAARCVGESRRGQ